MASPLPGLVAANGTDAIGEKAIAIVKVGVLLVVVTLARAVGVPKRRMLAVITTTAADDCVDPPVQGKTYSHHSQ